MEAIIMRKRLLGFILIMLISMPFVSAGFFDWWNSITGRATETPMANIIVDSVTISPQDPVAGSTVYVTAVAKNNGTATATTNGINTKNTLIVEGANSYITAIMRALNIPVGGTETFQFSYVATNPGTDQLAIKIDDPNSAYG